MAGSNHHTQRAAPTFVQSALPYAVFTSVLTFAYLAFWFKRPGNLSVEWLESLRAELVSLCAGQETQWQIALCMGLYFVGFSWLSHSLRGPKPATDRRQILIWLFALLASFSYAWDYPESASRNDYLVLLLALICSQGLHFWRSWVIRRSLHLDLGGAFLASFAIVTGVFALFHPEQSLKFEYREALRWSGVWSTPNVYGILTASAMIVTICRIFDLYQTLKSQGSSSRYRNWISLILWIVGFLITATSLLMSYSRGAWLGAAISLAVLICISYRRQSGIPRGTIPFRAAGLLVSIAVIGFWTLRHTEHQILRRVFTVVNLNDSSWRNRLATVPGAILVTAERPLLGHGWHQAESVYTHVFKPDHVTEGNAVTQNDFLMLAMLLGLPALACWTLWIVLPFVDNNRNRENHGFKITSKSTAIMASCPLLVGLMFDGILFKVATAVPLLCILELTKESQPDRVRTQSES